MFLFVRRSTCWIYLRKFRQQVKTPTVFLVQDFFQEATLSCATSVRSLACPPSSHFLLLLRKTCRSLFGMCQRTNWSFEWTDWYSHVSFSFDGSWLSTVQSIVLTTENWLRKLYTYSTKNYKSTEDKHETNHINKYNDTSSNTRKMHNL